MKKTKKIIAYVILILSVLVVVFMGTDSLAKYVLRFEKQLEGHYVDYRLSHNGKGKSAVLEGITTQAGVDSTGTAYEYNYEGFTTLAVENTLDGKISQRNIKFSLRTPTEDELNAGVVKDAWHNEYKIEASSENYEVIIVDLYGNPLSSTSDEYEELTTLIAGDSPVNHTLNLKIVRRVTSKIGTSVEELVDGEALTIILETSVPYRDVQIFNVKVSNRLVMVSTVEQEYFGFNQLEVDLKTSQSFKCAIDDNQYISNLPVKIEILLSDNIVFDEERFKVFVENNLIELENINNYNKGYYLDRTDGVLTKITLFIPSASNVKLYFYLNGDANITMSVTFKSTDDSIYDYTGLVAGITDGVIFE